MFEDVFFGADALSVSTYRDSVRQVTDTLISALPGVPYSGLSPAELNTLLDLPVGPRASRPLDAALQDVEGIIRNSINLWHPRVAAHLHTPVLIAALAAEMVISALNQSMDSFDQAPAATLIEQRVIAWLCGLAGLPATSSGTFTAGGTQSNYFGLLLARDRFAARKWDWDVRTRGLPPESNRLKILCSEIAHFSVEKSAIQLGLGTGAVVKVPVDSSFQMCPDSLRRAIVELVSEGSAPFAVVATAGSTDFGSIDPLGPVAEIAREYNLWLHVDAAYGGALLMSDRHRGRLAAIEQADSITMDFHKAFFQPISCGAFLLADRENFRFIRVNAAYLNPERHDDEGIPDLVTSSLLTTRRFDALKLWFCLRTLGTEGFGKLIDAPVDSARAAAAYICENKSLDLLCNPAFGCVIFKYVPASAPAAVNVVNASIPKALFSGGKAVIGQTVVDGNCYLKLTLSNPCTAESSIIGLLDCIVDCGRSLEENSVE